MENIDKIIYFEISQLYFFLNKYKQSTVINLGKN